MNSEFKRMCWAFLFFATAIFLAFRIVAGEGESTPSQGVGRDGLTTSPSPSSTPTSNFAPEYKLPPDRQVLLRAAWYDLTASERSNICAFMTEAPQDAISQAVREGYPKRDARHVVKFVVGELC